MIKFEFNICWKTCMYLSRGSAHISVGKHVYRQEAQHTCCAANKYVQHSLFANKLQNVNLNYGKHANIDGASWLISVLF